MNKHLRKAILRACRLDVLLRRHGFKGQEKRDLWRSHETFYRLCKSKVMDEKTLNEVFELMKEF